MIRKFFLKRLKNYFTILMIPAFVLFIFILFMTANSRIHSIRATSQNALENMDDTFDLITANCFYQQDLMTLNPQLSLSLRKIFLFKTSNYSDYVFLNSMQTILNSAAKSHPFIQSIYLFLNQHDSFFSSNKGICSLQNYYDTSWYDIYTQLPEDVTCYIVPRQIPASGNSGAIDVMTIYQKMSYLDGIIVANIPIDTFLNNIKSIFPAWENYFFILNMDNDILISNMEMSDTSADFAGYFQNMQQFSKKSNWAIVNGNIFMKNTIHNDNYGLTFVLMTPLSAVIQNTMTDLTWPLIIIIANSILVFILSLTTTKSNFSQIQYVIDLFDDAEKGIFPTDDSPKQNVESEYDLILNNVIRLFLNTTFLNSQLAEQKYKKQVAELSALQLQINPHFMVNTLQTLNFEVYKEVKKPTPVNTIIENLSDILKYSLAPVNVPVTISDELENIHKYIQIQKYRFPDRFVVYEDAEDEIMPLPFKRLILQPLVENSITHGLRPASDYSYIKIRIFVRNNKIHVSVIDNGIGMSRQKLKSLRENLSQDTSAGRIGLDNVNKRLILNYGDESRLRILSHEGLGTAISFSIPIQKNSDPLSF